MSDAGSSAATIIDQQVKELDGIEKRTIQDFNTTLGTERGPVEDSYGGVVSSMPDRLRRDGLSRRSSMSFTNDLIEEFSDEVNVTGPIL